MRIGLLGFAAQEAATRDWNISQTFPPCTLASSTGASNEYMTWMESSQTANVFTTTRTSSGSSAGTINVNGSGSSSNTGSGYKRASRKGAPRRFVCDHAGCEKIYSRAEHLQRHQLNRKLNWINDCCDMMADG